jgi:hypothetical protein
LERSQREIAQVDSPSVRPAEQTQWSNAGGTANDAPVPGNSAARHPATSNQMAWTQLSRHDRFKLAARVAVAISDDHLIADKKVPLAAAWQMKVGVVPHRVNARENHIA